MKLVFCVDENGGVAFNNRRQSRDKAVINDLISISGEDTVYADAYSAKLFPGGFERLTVTNDPAGEAGESGFCFIERRAVSDIAAKAEGLVIYRWNRTYPSDVKFDIDPVSLGFHLYDNYDVKGNSHDKITVEIYKK